jgi:hypothetical protein
MVLLIGLYERKAMRTQLILVSLAVMLLISACGAPPAVTPPPQPPKAPIVVSGSASRTPSPEAGAATPPLQTLVSSSASCFDLLTPENNGQLPSTGPINFTWQPLQGAARYVVDIKLPDGSTLPFETSDTKLRRYAESTAIGGTYEWQVTAYDASGATLCTAGPLSYFKPELSKPEKKKPGSQPACPAPQGCTNWDPVACVCNG